jgi:hypothetical protein
LFEVLENLKIENNGDKTKEIINYILGNIKTFVTVDSENTRKILEKYSDKSSDEVVNKL